MGAAVDVVGIMVAGGGADGCVADEWSAEYERESGMGDEPRKDEPPVAEDENDAGSNRALGALPNGGLPGSCDGWPTKVWRAGGADAAGIGSFGDCR